MEQPVAEGVRLLRRRFHGEHAGHHFLYLLFEGLVLESLPFPVLRQSRRELQQGCDRLLELLETVDGVIDVLSPHDAERYQEGVGMRQAHTLERLS